MQVYIEYVLIDNFIIDYLLLKASFVMTGICVKKRRLFLCAFLGSAFALVFPLLNFNLFFISLLKIISGAIIILISYNYKTVKSFFVQYLCFLFLTFALGGILLGICSIFNIEPSNLSLWIFIIPIYCIIKVLVSVILYFYHKTLEHSFNCDCTLFKGEKVLQINGFIDTGNALTYQNKPIIVIGKKNIFSIISVNDFIKNTTFLKYKTSAGIAKMPIYSIDKIVVKFENKIIVKNNIFVGVGEVGEKQLLLSPVFLEENNENNISKIKGTY